MTFEITIKNKETGEIISLNEASSIILVGEKEREGFFDIAGNINIDILARLTAVAKINAREGLANNLAADVARKQGVTSPQQIEIMKHEIRELFLDSFSHYAGEKPELVEQNEEDEIEE